MSVTTYFSIKLEDSPSVHLDGYVERNDKLGEDCDWFYYDRNNMPSNQMFIEHDDIDGFKGATEQQENEIELFKIAIKEQLIFDSIVQATPVDLFYNEDTIVKWGVIIKIESIETDCKFDVHDFLNDSCDKCGMCSY